VKILYNCIIYYGILIKLRKVFLILFSVGFLSGLIKTWFLKNLNPHVFKLFFEFFKKKQYVLSINRINMSPFLELHNNLLYLS